MTQSQKPYNPFLHDHSSHGHDHHHHEPEVPYEELDPAQRSLADALKVSFQLLKLAMVGLVIAYLLTGVFWVREQQKAIRLRFGSMVGESDSARVIGPGGPYFSWPFPIEQLIFLPTATQQVTIERAFWFEVTTENASKTLDEMAGVKGGPLNPERDGSLLTGDANIVHCRWTVSYILSKPVDFVKNVGDPRLAEGIIIRAAEQGIVHTIASLTADEVIRGQNYSETARKHIQRSLDAIGAGLEITSVAVLQPTMPLSVRDAYQAVINAENDRAQNLEKAQQERAKILGETAGEAWSGLLKLVEAVESAEKDTDPTKLQIAEARLTKALVDLRLPEDMGGLPIGGKVAESLNDASTYRTQIVEQVRSEAETFRRLLPLYNENPRIVRGRLWQDVKESVLSSDIETIYLPKGRPMLELNRDPAIARKRQQEAIRKEQGQ